MVTLLVNLNGSHQNKPRSARVIFGQTMIKAGPEIFWISRERPHVTQIMWNHCRNKLTPDWKYIFNHFFDFQFYRIIFISPSHSVIKDYCPTIFQLKTIKKSPKVFLSSEIFVFGLVFFSCTYPILNHLVKIFVIHFDLFMVKRTTWW